MENRKLSLGEMAAMVSGEVAGNEELIIEGLSSFEQAKEGEISFVAKVKEPVFGSLTRASALLVPMAVEEADIPVIRVRDPYLASAIIHNYFLESDFVVEGIHATVSIGTDCTIHENVSIRAHVAIGKNVTIGQRTLIHPGVVIGDNVTIGEGCVLRGNVTIEHECSLGNRVILHAGTVIGSDGFGYAANELGCHIKRPQVGTVVIGDDVEIGANCCIDRAAFGVTEIKSGSKLDNMVQVGHNVVMGENCIVVAQVGIAGSVTMGRNVVLGGQAGLSGHISLDDGVMVAARGGVHTNLEKGSVVGGAPAMPVKQWGKSSAIYAKLPEMRKEIRALKKEVQALKKNEE